MVMGFVWIVESLGLEIKDQNLVSRLLLHFILLGSPIFYCEDCRNGNLGCLVFAYWVVGGFGFIWVVLLCLQMWLISTFFFALFPFCKRRRGEFGFMEE